MPDTKKLEELLKKTQEKEKQLAKQLKEQERKDRTRALILFAEYTIKQLIRTEGTETLLQLSILDAKGRDYSEAFQKEVLRIQEILKGGETDGRDSNGGRQGSTGEPESMGTLQQNALKGVDISELQR